MYYFIYAHPYIGNVTSGASRKETDHCGDCLCIVFGTKETKNQELRRLSKVLLPVFQREFLWVSLLEIKMNNEEFQAPKLGERFE